MGENGEKEIERKRTGGTENENKERKVGNGWGGERRDSSASGFRSTSAHALLYSWILTFVVLT